MAANPGLRSKLRISSSQGHLVRNANTDKQSVAFSIHCVNEGQLAAVGAIHRCTFAVSEELLSETELESLADDAAKFEWLRSNNEIEPNEQRFFTCPSDEAGFSALSSHTEAVLAGRSRIYLFVAIKYWDRSMPQKSRNVVERCGWFSGDLQVMHMAGRNRSVRVY